MKKFTLLATSIIPIMAIAVVSCEKDDELNEFNYDLDVNSNVTLTKRVYRVLHIKQEQRKP